MRILLLDDDRRVARFLEGLREEGHTVDVARDLNGLERRRLREYDLLLVDVQLSGEASLDAVRALGESMAGMGGHPPFRGTGVPDRLRYCDLEVDRLRHVACRGGRRMHLTPTELHLLEILMLNAERVVPRTEVFETVWCPPLDPTSNVVDVHMAHLRRKLREGGAGPAIHTVRGVGYVLRT